MQVVNILDMMILNQLFQIPNQEIYELRFLHLII